MEGYQEDIFKEKIIAYLKTLPQNTGITTGITLAKVVINTGIATEWAEYTLRQLMDDYPVFVEINEHQELLYFFDLNPKPVPLGKMMQNATKWIFNTTTWVLTLSFKAWIVAMLCTYFLFNFVAIIAITLVIAGEGGGALLEGIFNMLGGIFAKIGDFFLKMVGWKSHKKLQEEFEFETKKTELLKEGKSKEEIKIILKEDIKILNQKDDLLQDIFSYVFGSNNIEIRNTEYWEKLALKLIEAQNGIILVTDLIQLQGISLRDARLQATKLISRHRGEILVDKQGNISYYFPDLVTKTFLLEIASENNNSENNFSIPAFIWENPIPLEKINDNDKEINKTIGWINGFNIIMSFISTFAIQWFFYSDAIMPDWILVTSLIIPLLFSVTFFTIPLLRKPFLYFKNRKIKKQNKKADIYKRIFESMQKNNGKIQKFIPQNTEEQQICIALEGNPTAENNGKVGYKFEEF